MKTGQHFVTAEMLRAKNSPQDCFLHARHLPHRQKGIEKGRLSEGCLISPCRDRRSRRSIKIYLRHSKQRKSRQIKMSRQFLCVRRLFIFLDIFFCFVPYPRSLMIQKWLYFVNIPPNLHFIYCINNMTINIIIIN